MHQDSELITGIKTGKWIALDGLKIDKHKFQKN